MKTECIIGRRTFIKGAAIFSGLAALLGLTRPATARPKESPAQPDEASQGYRLTEHVKRYYETARL
jgi:hypothetical protein